MHNIVLLKFQYFIHVELEKTVFYNAKQIYSKNSRTQA